MSATVEKPALETRLETLERRLALTRALLWAGLGGLWLATVAFVWYSTTLRPTLAAQELVLVDELGRPRAFLDVKQDGATYLIFYDAQGRERQALGVDADGRPALALLGLDEKPRLSLRLDDAENPSIHWADVERRERLRVENSAAGPAIRTWDAAGQETKRLGE